MATIHVEKQHSLGLEEAKTRGHELLEKFRQRLSKFLGEPQWNGDGTQGKALGDKVDAFFQISENRISVDVELKSLPLRLMKGQIEDQIKGSLDKKFG